MESKRTPRGRRASRKRSLGGRGPSGKTNRQPCKDFLQGLCTKLPCDYWHPPECQFCKSETDCKCGNKCSFPHRKVEEQPNKKQKKRMVTKMRWLLCEMCDCWVAYCRTRSRSNLYPFYKRAQKSWDVFDEYDSQELRCVMRVSEKIKDIAWKNTSQKSSSAQALRYEI